MRAVFSIFRESFVQCALKEEENIDKPKRRRGRPKGSKNKNKQEVALNAEMQQIKSMLLKVKSLFADGVK